jgi:hypothetical protein
MHACVTIIRNLRGLNVQRSLQNTIIKRHAHAEI